MGPYIAQIIVFSIWFTWLYNNTNGSILASILFHTMMDLTLYTIFPVKSIFPFYSLPVLYMYVSGGVITAMILVVSDPKRLVHKNR